MREALRILCVAVVVLVASDVLAASPEGRGGTSDSSEELEPQNPDDIPNSAQHRRLTLLLDAYAEMYGKFMGNREPFVRALAAVALGRAAGKQTTDKLIGALSRERHPIVQMVIWETLHARTKSLSDEHYDRWVSRGIDTAMRGAFRGDLRVGLIKAMAPYGSSGMHGRCGRYVTYLKKTCRTDNPFDAQTLAALKDVAWAAKGSGKGDGDKYRGASEIIPAPIVPDPDDRSWRDMPKLSDLMIPYLDLCFVIDCTASMLQPMQWVAKDVGKMMRVFEFISSRPRIGVVYFRHEVDRRILAPCCATFKKNRPGPMFATVTRRLTSSVSTLSAMMMKVDPRAGNSLHQGSAVHGGLITATKQQPWSKSPKAKKVIVLIGDSPITTTAPKALPIAKALAADMHKTGFVIHGMLLDDLPSYAEIVRAGGGTSMRMSFPRPARPGGARKPVPRPTPGINGPYARLVGGIARPLLSTDPDPLVDPLMHLLLLYTEAEPSR